MFWNINFENYIFFVMCVCGVYVEWYFLFYYILEFLVGNICIIELFLIWFIFWMIYRMLMNIMNINFLLIEVILNYGEFDLIYVIL